MTLEAMLRLIAGAFVTASVVLGVFVSPYFFLFTVFVGLNLVMPEDIVIAISASGNSKNVLNAVSLAKTANAITIGFTGFDGGKLCSMVDINIHVNSNIIEHVEDIHLILEHMIVRSLRERVYSEPISQIVLEDVQTS